MLFNKKWVFNNLYNCKSKLYIVHWIKDRNINYRSAINNFYKIKNNIWINNSKILLISWWVHWSPLRMIDYFDTLNFFK